MKRCAECGVETDACAPLCPLCGANLADEPSPRVVTDVDDYQQRVRALREQLRVLRDEAEAV